MSFIFFGIKNNWNCILCLKPFDKLTLISKNNLFLYVDHFSPILWQILINEYQTVELESDDKIITMMIIRKENHDVGARKQQGVQQLHESGTYFNSLHVQISYFCRKLEMWQGYIATFKYSA